MPIQGKNKSGSTRQVRIDMFIYMYMYIYIFKIKNNESGLPWWRSGWESACQCRGHRFESWSGKIPHAVERLGPWATIAEPARLEPVFCNKRGRVSERPAHRDEEWPPLATTRESPRTETKTQHSHKKKKKEQWIIFKPIKEGFMEKILAMLGPNGQHLETQIWGKKHREPLK